MRPIATGVARSVVCVSVCVFGHANCCAKTAEPIEMPFGVLTLVGPRISVLDVVFKIMSFVFKIQYSILFP